jgi:predicted ester cyclase
MAANESPVMEANKKVVRRFVERLVDSPEPEMLDEFLAPDFIDHYAPPEQDPGREGMKKVFERVHRVLADLRIVLEDMIAEGDRVVIRIRAEARQVGSFMGFPPAGKEICWTTISIYRLENGRIMERWGLMDHGYLLRQFRDTKHPAV